MQATKNMRKLVEDMVLLINRLLVISAVFIFGSYGIVYAHHSHGNYQIGEEITVQGVVTEFHFANPHVWVFMDVENEQGKVE